MVRIQLPLTITLQNQWIYVSNGITFPRTSLGGDYAVYTTTRLNRLRVFPYEVFYLLRTGVYRIAIYSSTRGRQSRSKYLKGKGGSKDNCLVGYVGIIYSRRLLYGGESGLERLYSAKAYSTPTYGLGGASTIPPGRLYMYLAT